ncbi:periplasmic binding protein-like I, partial [Gamsiella multidivaricata]|uniref:periplasmic binding protein-like I n=1 Tax=Gamsiella multidivaricata TaxID=101098 RepID=UPI00221EF39D
VGAVIGDISSDLTMAEAIMTSSIGIPQCSFCTYNMDETQLSTYGYFFRTVPGVVTYLEGLMAVIRHYGWRRISILYTSDVPGLLGTISTYLVYAYKKRFVTLTKVVIFQRIGIDRRKVILEDSGLFSPNHVWLTTIDLSNSLSVLPSPSDFNGLIMADALWNMPGDPAYDKFVARWTNSDLKE